MTSETRAWSEKEKKIFSKIILFNLIRNITSVCLYFVMSTCQPKRACVCQVSMSYWVEAVESTVSRWEREMSDEVIKNLSERASRLPDRSIHGDRCHSKLIVMIEYAWRDLWNLLLITDLDEHAMSPMKMESKHSFSEGARGERRRH